MGTAKLRLVVGVCEHAHSIAALRYAAQRARASRADLVAVHVQRAAPPALSYFDVSGVLRAWAAECEELAFSDLLGALAGQRLSWRYLSLHGDPARCLATVAAETGAAAIVLGQDRRRSDRFRRTVARALRRGPVPLVLVDADAQPVPAGWRQERAA
jgi:nucleotide-binding universal stress UspA family protein